PAGVDNTGIYDAARILEKKERRRGEESLPYSRLCRRIRDLTEPQQTENDPFATDPYLHVQQTNYLCTDCGREYKWLDSLKRHKRVDCGNKEKRFSCHVCDKKFKYRYELKNHIVAHHRIFISI
ncbi:uncharacterized protein LOC143354707, partial [Halictus rubicundus]|uniref:uncharacterized protein LOC143354707 n=1 Tax=Halictus rubicundus TaxID=77578 RepID=UPI0040360157